MSTTNVESWVDKPLAEIGAVYPFVGSEGLLVILLVAAWIGWHIWQVGLEKQQEQELLSLVNQERAEEQTPDVS